MTVICQNSLKENLQFSKETLPSELFCAPTRQLIASGFRSHLGIYFFSPGRNRDARWLLKMQRAFIPCSPHENHENSLRWVLLFPFYQWEKQPRQAGGLTKVTWLVRSGGGTSAQVWWHTATHGLLLYFSAWFQIKPPCTASIISRSNLLPLQLPMCVLICIYIEAIAKWTLPALPFLIGSSSICYFFLPSKNSL